MHCYPGRLQKRRPGRILTAGAAVPALVLAVTACGSSTTTSPTAAGSASPGSGSAYFNCLREHGVTRSGGSSATTPSTGSTPSSTVNSARQDCASLRPSGGFGGFGGSGTFSAAFQKFESCLSAHGVTLPSSSDGGFRSLFGELQSGSTADQAAFNACKSDLPFHPGG
jgi:hypothetical protein